MKLLIKNLTTFLLIILFVTLAEAQKSTKQKNSLNVKNAPDDNKNSKPPRQCTPAICPRNYMPVCILVDGIPLTAPTMCHYHDKQRCLRELLEEGETMPVFEFLHEGRCTDDDPNIIYNPNILKKAAAQKKNVNGKRKRPNKQANRRP